jgi:predicted RND superfamily exporter protein
LLLIMALGVLWRHGLRFDRSANVLKPKKSEATAALEQIRFHFGVRQEPMWVLVPGNDEAEVIERFASVNKVLSGAVSNRLIAAFTLPTELWAQPENQQANRAVAATLLQQRETLQSAAFSAGFTSKALLFTEGVLDSWENAVKSTKTYWPTNSASRWVLDKVVTHSSDGLVGLGWVERTADASGAKQLSVEWPDELMRQGIVMSGWELLGSTVFDLVVGEMPILVLPIVTLVLISLWLAFRSLKEVVLSVGTLSFAGLCLVAAMDLLKWDWNILNSSSVGHGCGFLHTHPTGPPSTQRRFAPGSAVGGARTSAGRHDNSYRFCLSRIFDKHWHGKPGQGLRARYCPCIAHRGIFTPGMVVGIQA